MTRWIYDFEPEWAAYCERDFTALRRLFSTPAGLDRLIDDFGDTLLHVAVRDGDVAMVELLLQLPCRRCLASFDELSYTPLHHAAKDGRADLAERLLAAGADPNANNETRIGNTPIREAVYHGHPEIVALLLRAGADPTIPGWMAITAVDEAHHSIVGGLDTEHAKAIQRLLAGFPSAVRDRARPSGG